MHASLQSIRFTSYAESVPAVLDALGAREVLSAQRKILIKPNLVNASPPPVTTPVACCEAIVTYIRRYGNAQIIIGEGCGAAAYDTAVAFEALGYLELSRRLDIPLVDLNQSPTVLLKHKACPVLPEIHLPAVALNSFLFSVPVLKAHSLAEITGTLKNMMGLAPPKYYQQGGHWKKSAFHRQLHQAILDLNRYIRPALTLMDARTGLASFHLGGPECNPPIGKLLAGFDPLAVDRQAAVWLGLDWRKIPHLAVETLTD